MTKTTKGSIRTLILTAIVVGFASYVYFGEFKKSQDEQKKKELDTMVLPAIAFDKVSHIEWWTGPNQTVNVDKKDGVWTLHVPRPIDDPSRPLTDRASTEQVENFLKKFLQLRSTETVLRGVFDEKTFGLDMPMFEVKIAEPTSAKLHGVRIGSVKAYDANLYAQLDDDKAVLLVPNGALEAFRKTPEDFRERSLYRLETKIDWTDISIIKEGQQVLHLVRRDKTWSSETTKNLDLDSAAVDAYLKRLENVQTIGFTYEGHDLKPFKLDRPYLLVTLRNAQQKSWEMRLSKPKDNAAQSPSGAMQASVMATATDVPAIVKVLDQNVKVIDKRAQDFVRSAKPAPKGHL